MLAVSHELEVVWVPNEAADMVPQLAALAPEIHPAQKLLGRIRFSKGQRHDELLAVSHAHGAELDWLAG